jgi:heat shock protein HslJ
MRSTLAFCENDDIMVREFAYLDALGRVESYHLDGDTLTLQGDNGQVLMTFQPKAST